MRVLYWNVENMFLKPWSETDVKVYPKSPQRLEMIKETIFKIDPDIIALSEVGGEESLDLFAKDYLQSKYISSIIKGNSERGIEVGYLIKKGLPYRFEHLTHRNRELDLKYNFKKKKGPFYLSRDFAELRVFDQDAESETPSLILFNLHLKSALDPEGVDPQGFLRREAECKLLAKTYKLLRKKFGTECPIIIGGDFNGEARLKKDSENRGSREFYDLSECEGLNEVLKEEAIEDRFTYFGINRQRVLTFLQLDNIFYTDNLIEKLDPRQTGRPRIWRNQKDLIPLPKTNADKYSHPSDHYPLLITFEL